MLPLTRNVVGKPSIILLESKSPNPPKTPFFWILALCKKIEKAARCKSRNGANLKNSRPPFFRRSPSFQNARQTRKVIDAQKLSHS